MTVGTELMLGLTVDTNAAYLARALASVGARVVRKTSVPDDPARIKSAVTEALSRTGWVIVTGGLGPTPDDVTREALAGAAGTLLVVDKELRAEVMRRTGGKSPRRNARMARIPEGSRILPNPVGSAAGLRAEVGGTPVYALPGVPMELEAIFEESVLPDLVETFAGAEPVPSRVLRIYGLREAAVADKLGDLLARGKAPTVGVTVRDGIITVTVSGQRADQRAEEIREKLGRHVFGEGEATLASVVLDTLAERKATLAVGESITGGLLASTIVDVPGASNVFTGAVVAYTPELKKELLGVPKTVLAKQGTVSEETALRLARGARRRLGATVGLATTGVAGPDSDERGTPIGHGFVAVADAKGSVAKKLRVQGSRKSVRQRFVWAALDLLRRRL